VAELERGPRATTVERTIFAGSDGATVETIHASPTDGAAMAGVVLHPDIMGVRDLFDDLSDRIASHGYAVACPEPFARAPEEIAGADDPMVRMGAVSELDDAVQLDDLRRAADLLAERDRVERVHVMGFCMGGMQVLKAAATGRFARAVAFYGMIRLPEAWRGPRTIEPLERASEVCPTLAIFGSVDPYTPASDIDALRAAWRDRPDCEIVVYDGADHGFVHAPERPVHRADDAADAWHRTLAWFART
jgi:carboxymethylenebutenolidase